MSKVYNLAATPHDRDGSTTYVSTIVFDEMSVELTTQTVNSNGIDPTPYDVKYHKIQKQEIQSVKSCKRNIMKRQDKLILLGIWFVFMIIGCAGFGGIPGITYIKTVFVYAILLTGCFYLALYLGSLRVILITLKDGEKIMIPWHGDVRVALTEEDQERIEEIIRQFSDYENHSME